MPKKTDTRPAGGARAPFKKKSKPSDHDVLMKASKAYNDWHNRTIQVGGVDVAETIAQGVVQQCNAWGPIMFSSTECPYPAQALLEEVIQKLQERV